METIHIKYHDDACRVERIDVGDWIDLRCQEDVHLSHHEYSLIPLGVSMRLPEGYEAWVLPRSSTFAKHGIVMANGMGVIDNSYCGDGDVWHFPAIAMRSTSIPKGTRIAQFRIMPRMTSGSDVEFVEVDELGGENRGGFGSTGER